MKISCEPDDTELTINIGSGILSFIDVEAGIDLEVFLSESDMDYLKKRLVECWKT